MSLTLTMTKGLPGSGKTTWARNEIERLPNGAVCRINKDDMRAMMHSGTWTKGNEKLVLRVRDQIITQALAVGQHVIVDDTNLAPRHEERLRQLAREAGAEFVVRDFTDVPLDVCHERNLQRPNPVPPKVIDDMWRQFLKPEPDRTWDDPTLPECVIVDIDGTLAHMTGRGPFDWARVGEDAIDENVAWLVGNVGLPVILLSGRDSVCEDETREWLAEHGIEYAELRMRAEGDMRKDTIVKRELFDQQVRGRWRPRFVVDDRKQVVDMWRNDLGLTVWQVAEGDF